MWFIVKSYFWYWLTAKRNLSSFSPFILNFSKNILSREINPVLDYKIKSLRQFYLQENKDLPKEDYGAGSKTSNLTNTINTMTLVREVAIPSKYGVVLYNLVRYYNIKLALELGTSLGIGSAYLSAAKVTTIEGNSSLANYTRQALLNHEIESVKVINAKFDEVLEDLITHNKFGLIFIDGNHTYESTLAYFDAILKKEHSSKILIFDDIHWSAGMNKAWKEIKANKNVTKSIDLFKFGIVFIHFKEEQKEDIVIWY